jgi:hypothetical protein
MASTRALESTSAGDRDYRVTEGALALLDHARDALAGQIKRALSTAEFGGGQVNGALGLVVGCKAIIAIAGQLAR